MTTIACNKDELAGDLQFTNMSDFSKWKGVTKVYRFEPHEKTYSVCPFIVGFAGTAQDIITVSEFFSQPDEFNQLPKVKGLRGLVLTERRDIFVFDTYTHWIKVNQPYMAIGTGAPFSMGVLAAGGSPTEAIKVAMKHDSFTGFGVKSLRFK